MSTVDAVTAGSNLIEEQRALVALLQSQAQKFVQAPSALRDISNALAAQIDKLQTLVGVRPKVTVDLTSVSDPINLSHIHELRDWYDEADLTVWLTAEQQEQLYACLQAAPRYTGSFKSQNISWRGIAIERHPRFLKES